VLSEDLLAAFARALESSAASWRCLRKNRRPPRPGRRDLQRDLPPFTEDTCPGSEQSCRGRVSNCFNLGGGGVVFDAACASSLAAVDAAVTGLREGRFDLVVAGGQTAGWTLRPMCSSRAWGSFGQRFFPL